MSRLIDLHHLHTDRVIAAYEVDGLIIDPGPESCLETLLRALGDEVPRGLLLTHIHLDHAGATGSLVERYPDLRVHVHERGAPHLIDPTKLLASARQLYGADMDRLWGDVRPVPEGNLHVLTGGERVEGFRVEYTPGHASHHVSYLHEATGEAFVGDTAGVRIPPRGPTIPPTPPPDIDLEAWAASIDILEGWRPTALCATHFGRHPDVAFQLADLRESLARFSDTARTHDEGGFIDYLREEIAAYVGEDEAAHYVQAAPPDQLYKGLERYWRKREERRPAQSSEAPASVPVPEVSPGAAA